MAWKGKGNKGGGKGARVTGFFKSKSNGDLFVGKSRAEEIEAIIPIIKKAKAEGKELAWFLYKNKAEEGKPALALKVDVSEPMKKDRGDDFDDDKGSEDIGL